MKNVKENQLKKCIFMKLAEFESLVIQITDGLKEVEYEFGMYYIDTDKAEAMDVYWNEDIEKTLSKYFGVNVTSVHADDCDDVGVWIVYK